MTDGLRKSHLRKAPQVGLSEVGLPDIYHFFRHKNFLYQKENLATVQLYSQYDSKPYLMS